MFRTPVRNLKSPLSVISVRLRMEMSSLKYRGGRRAPAYTRGPLQKENAGAAEKALISGGAPASFSPLGSQVPFARAADFWGTPGTSLGWIKKLLGPAYGHAPPPPQRNCGGPLWYCWIPARLQPPTILPAAPPVLTNFFPGPMGN